MTQIRTRSAKNKTAMGAVGIGLSLCLGFCPTAASQEQVAEPSRPAPASLSCSPRDLSRDLPSDLPILVTQLMWDLPSYGNRVIQRAGKIERPTLLYIMAAGQVDISPVSLTNQDNIANRSRLPNNDSPHQAAPAEEIYQILFTTLERQYGTSSAIPGGAISSRKPRSSLQVSSAVESPMEPRALPMLDPIVGQTPHRSASIQQRHWLVLARQQDLQEPEQAAPWRIVSLRSQLVPYPANNVLLAPTRDSRQSPVGQGITLWLRDWHNGPSRLTDNPLVPSAGREGFAEQASDSDCPA